MTAAQRATLEALRDEVQDTWVSSKTTRDTLDALRAALGTCGNCAHADEMESQAKFVFCAAPIGQPERFPFRYQAMPLGERCTGYTPKEGA